MSSIALLTVFGGGEGGAGGGGGEPGGEGANGGDGGGRGGEGSVEQPHGAAPGQTMTLARFAGSSMLQTVIVCPDRGGLYDWPADR
jgi:hypothetical protein